MNREELEMKLDDWLDRATAEYGKAESRIGFEARICANVSNRLAKKQQRFRWVTLAAAAAAVLVFSCYVILSRFENHTATMISVKKEQRSDLPSAAKPARLPVVNQVESSARGHVKKRVPAAARDTGKGGFLSAGLSDQERGLLSFVKIIAAQASTGASEAEAESLQMPDFEIQTFQIPKPQISFIKIDMVQMPETNQSEDQL